MTTDRPNTNRKGARARTHEPKKYRDRPADEGKHGDAAEEPNSGVPSAPQDPPGRPTAACNNQSAHRDRRVKYQVPVLDPEVSDQPRARRRDH
jgi:hypothetical protein